jgi:hypothetical protein
MKILNNFIYEKNETISLFYEKTVGEITKKKLCFVYNLGH